MKVMLIDDSKTMRNIQRSVLKQIGIEQVEEACDGQDALSKVGAFAPDLILVDWNMPNMDGLTFIKAFRKQDKTTPLIMVTTEAEKSRVIEAIKAGVRRVNNYVVKPFTPDLLSQRINETMSKCAGFTRERAIDFHELSPFVIVHAGDTIGSISEATDGSDGVDVRGETIPAKRGRTQSIKTDYTTRAEGDRLVAAVPGRLVHAIDRVVIETTLTIADDVDYHTGNIDFPGSVVVHGAVKDNFRVRATGDIKLEGLVEAAAIDTAADLSLTRGMAGRGAGEIRVGGDLLAGYLDGVEGTIGGNCVVTNEIKACRLRVARRVESPACAFYGGDLHAGLRIELGTLGSEGGVETAVSVGEHDEIDDLAARTKSLIAAIETKKDRAASELAALNGAIKKLNATQAERLTELQFEQIQADGLVAKLGEAAAELLGVLGRHASPTLVVKRRLHAGVRIRLRHACFVIRESITGPVTFDLCHAGAPRCFLQGAHGSSPIGQLARLEDSGTPDPVDLLRQCAGHLSVLPADGEACGDDSHGGPAADAA
jgi:CheY-like chemotaxis protein